MRLYEGSVASFKELVLRNRIDDVLKEAFESYYKRSSNEREVRSWDNSLVRLKDVLDTAGLLENRIVIECELPLSRKRIDVLLFGRDVNGDDNVVVIELKQWSNDKVSDVEEEGNVLVNYGSFRKEDPHPSLQTEGYYYHLKDYMDVFEEKDPVLLSACVYCHNYSKGKKEVLYLSKFSDAIDRFPLFAETEMVELGDYLKEKIGGGKGLEVLKRFDRSVVKPSKKLLDHTNEMISRQKVFNLMDEQITSRNVIMSRADKVVKSEEKSVIIIPGGPGTGKSVIALEVMAELMRMGLVVFHATGSSAFTNTLRKILGTRCAKQFKFFNSFTEVKKNEIHVLICDEAHRIREVSANRYTPKAKRTGTPQIDELINASKISIFFIDEKQRVRPNEVGTIKLIEDSAKKHSAKTYVMPELKTQFRCAGSSKYLDWVESLLKISNEKPFLLDKKEMKFKIVKSAGELKKIIDKKNKAKKNSARIVAGFCWKWSKTNSDGSQVKDVKIGDFEMPWENKEGNLWKWATYDSGMEQVGTVYTSQGFEFDHIGVIFPEDLIYNEKNGEWEAQPEKSFDTVVKRNKEDMINHLKNVYRVLLTRAHKEVYIYFMNKTTEKHFKKHLK